MERSSDHRRRATNEKRFHKRRRVKGAPSSSPERSEPAPVDEPEDETKCIEWDPHVVFCSSCDQSSDQFEKDLLPEKEVLLAWSKTNVSKVTRKRKRSGDECTNCFGLRRKEYAGKTAAWVVEERKKSQEFKENHAVRRRARVRGETSFETTGTTASVKETERQVGRQVVKGHFYYLDDYCELNKAPAWVKTTRQKCEFVVNDLKMQVTRHPTNKRLGVEEVNMPAKAAFAFERGTEQSLELNIVTSFDDLEDAEEAYKEVEKEKAGEEDFNTGDDVLSEPEEPPAKRCRTSAPSCSSASVVGGQAGPSTAAPRALPRPQQLLANIPAPLPDEAVFAAAPSPQPSPRERSRSRDSKAPSTGRKEKESSKKVSMLKLNTQDPVKLLDLCGQVAAEVEEFDDSSLWLGKHKKRDVTSTVDRLKCAATKASAIVGAEDMKAAQVAESLYSLSEILLAKTTFLNDANKKPWDLIRKPCRDPATLRILYMLDPSVSAKVFTSISSASILKLSPAAMPTLGDLVRFLTCTPKSGLLTVGCLDENVKVSPASNQRVVELVQNNGLVNLLCHMFTNFTADDYEAAIKYLLDEKRLPVTRESNYFHKPNTAEYEKSKAWPMQCIIDWSLAVAMAQVFELERTQRRDLRLATTIQHLVSRKGDVSLRLRVFRGLKPSERNLGKQAWDLMEKLVREGDTMNSVSSAARAAWTEKVEPMGPLPEGWPGIATFAEWLDDNKTDVVLSLASQLSEVSVDGDEQLSAAKDRVRGYVLSVRGFSEIVLKMPSVAEEVRACPNGERRSDSMLADT